MNPEKRLKSIPTFAKRISQPDKEYKELKLELWEEARRRNCDVNDLRLAVDFYEEIEW
ncbi:hypothetical protein SAMN03080614_100376 [Anaerobranca gottschalkii DSM 13577]|uniref:Uncharacterized protein n=1 Tax=Anaerobranca gottschalkii DSM 13577 TaxID=1120990 RepID=A0A1H9YJL8_9FIRM|nr:hypothetical protein [Anaerobranca gottschalkii]SES69239.1 hypothetical protein SAMN03080614_100376 [Anaerobranca gottschalkii DSM 13577]